MAHDHAHHSHTPDLEHGNRRAFIAGICLNLGFVLVEVIAGVYYNSMALLTDAGHNISDVASLVLSLMAFWLARRRSTAEYTYGYKKTTILAALINAVILLIAIGVLGYESVTRLFDPRPVQGNVIAWVAGLGIVINGLSAALFFKNRDKDLNVRSAWLHLLADALVSFGVIIAGIVMIYTKWYWLDPAIGLLIMVVILVSTWSLLRDSFKMTIDAVPTGIELNEIKKIIAGIEHVRRVEHVHVWPLSTTENALTAHVALDEQLSFDEKLKLVARIRHELEHNNIQHSTIELIK